MNKTPNCLRSATTLLLFAGVFGTCAAPQNSKDVPHFAPAAGIWATAKEVRSARHPRCCLQSNTGQTGWTLVSAPIGVVTPQAAVTVTPPNPAWAPALPGSAWVGPSAASGTSNLPGGLYVYEFRFCLCRQEQGQQPVLSLLFFSDNGATVSLNGKFILSPFTPANNSFQHPSGPFPVVYAGPLAANDPKFRPCPQINTLTVAVQNQEGSDQKGTPTGLDAILNITGATASTDGECRCRL